METIEQEIQRKGLTAPRITPESIEANIASEHFANGADLVPNAGSFPDLKRLTLCICILKNGFIAVGASAPLSAENFNHELGMRAARNDTRKQIGDLMAYELRERMLRESRFEWPRG